MIIYAIFGEGCDVQTPIFILTYPSDNPTFTSERPKYPFSCPCLFSLSMYLLPIGTPVLDILILRSSLRCAGFGLMLGFRIILGIFPFFTFWCDISQGSTRWALGSTLVWFGNSVWMWSE